MSPREATPKRRSEHEIGKYVCPNTKALVPLVGTCALTEIEWPLVLEHCTDCQQRHVLVCEDVWHPPIYGYE